MMTMVVLTLPSRQTAKRMGTAKQIVQRSTMPRVTGKFNKGDSMATGKLGDV